MAQKPILVSLRRLLILAAGTFIAWVSIGVTADRALGSRFPSVAVLVWPKGVNGKIASVTGLLKAGSLAPQAIAEARSALRLAVLREPVNSPAVAGYAALADLSGEPDIARKFFKLSETLSRRNMLAQTWIIEDAVRRGDVAEAIVHYNRALAVSEPLRAQLLPILAAAASDPEIGAHLWPLLSRRPPWWREFLNELAKSSDSGLALSNAARASLLNGNNSSDAAVAELILRRMISLKEYRLATSLVEALAGRRSVTRGLVGGDFDAAEGILPYGWWLSDGTDVRAFRDQLPRGIVLRIEESGGVTGGAAQQLIALSPGAYTLSGIVGNHSPGDGTGVTIAIACAEGAELSRVKLPTAGPTGQRFVASFTVPRLDCEAQWLNIIATSDEPVQAWLDKLRISKV